MGVLRGFPAVKLCVPGNLALIYMFKVGRRTMLPVLLVIVNGVFLFFVVYSKSIIRFRFVSYYCYIYLFFVRN